MELATYKRPQPAASSGLKAAYIWIVASVAAISGFLFGFDTAVINGALVFLQKQFSLSSLQSETAASSLLLGCLLGAVGAGTLSDKLGRRKNLMGAALLFTLSAIGSAASQSFGSFLAARFIGGLAIGLASALTPIYISEVAPRESRGRLVSLNQLAIVTGILVAYLANWRLSQFGEHSWRWMFGVAGLPSIGFLLGLLFIPESPRWLIAKGRKAEGEAVLVKISGTAEAANEMAAIEHAVAEETSGLRELFSTGMRVRLLVAVALAMLSQICGINTVLYYGSILFAAHFHGQSASAAIGANILVGVVNLLCTIAAMFFIDRWGRRGLFLVSSAGMALSLAVLSFSLRSPNAAPALIFGSVLFYVALFAVGMGPGVWVYVAEIFPTRVRAQATSLATAALWSACLAVTMTFLSIVERLGMPTAFLLYAVLSLVTFLFVWKFVPETRGKSLEEIQEMWGQN